VFDAARTGSIVWRFTKWRIKSYRSFPELSVNESFPRMNILTSLLDVDYVAGLIGGLMRIVLLLRQYH
jgi:hypothetical protein